MKQTKRPRKLILLFIFIAILVLSFFLFGKNNDFFDSSKNLNPASDSTHFIKKLKLSLDQSSLPLLGEIKIYQSKNIAIFHTKDNIRVIFSLEKDPYFQVTSLQQILKTARINTKQIEKIDLSLKKPYVTFKDN